MIAKIFEYNGQAFPVLEHSEYGWLFDASVVCRQLLITDAQVAIRKLENDEKILLTRTDFDSVKLTGSKSDLSVGIGSSEKGGAQKKWYVTESGLYKLIMRSNKPEAKEFQNWVCHEVLPALRQTGTYSMPNVNLAQLPYPNLYTAANALGKTAYEYAIAEMTAIKAGLMQIFKYDEVEASLSACATIKEEYGLDFVTKAKIALPAPVQKREFTPSELEQEVNLHDTHPGRAMNRVLESAGMQFKNVAGDWELTELGERYAVYKDTRLNNAKKQSVRSIKWFRSVLDVEVVSQTISLEKIKLRNKNNLSKKSGGQQNILPYDKD